MIRNWILQNLKRWEGSCGWAKKEKTGWDKSCIFYWFLLMPSGGPVWSSVEDLWGFYWGVWRLSESLGVGSGSWKDLREEGRDSSWLCAEGSVCWRGRCGGSVTGQRWGRPSLWEPGGILASVEDCRLEESLNCFLKRLEYLHREQRMRGKTVSLYRNGTTFVKQM